MSWRPIRILALIAVVAIATSVGWDDALWDPRLQALLHLAPVLAIGTAAWAAWRGEPMPRTRIDIAILALLVAYGIATISAWNVGLSAPALAGIVATTLMLPVALLALRRWPNLTALVAVVPVIGLSAISLATLAWRRIEWVAAGGPGLPPVRLPNEVTQLGLVTVPPFALLLALPVALVVGRPDVRKWLVWALIALCVPLTLVSGSRSAWIAFAVAGVVMAATSLHELRAVLRLSRLRIGSALGLVAVGGFGLAFVAPRLTETGSLLYRSRLWDATLRVWSADPLLGIGPGGMPYARQAIAPLVQPHSHDVPLGILGDAGLAGLALALILFARFVTVARPRRGHPLPGRAAFAVLMGLAAGFLTDDLTFLPNINLLVMLLVAIALRDAGAVAWRPIPRPQRRWLIGGLATAAVGLLSVAIVADASSIWYRAGSDAAVAGRWADARGAFTVSNRLDPLHPAAPKALSLVAAHDRLTALARSSAERAVALNSGDWASWTNLSLLCLADGDEACAATAAQQSVQSSGGIAVALVNAARVFEALGRPAEADALYGRALLTDWQTGLAVDWPRAVAPVEPQGVATGAFDNELALLVARRQRGEGLQPDGYALASVRALAYAMDGNRAAARRNIAAAYQEQPADPLTWDVAALLQAHWGEDNTTALRVGAVTRGWPLATRAPALPSLSTDIGSFRSYPGDALIVTATRLFPPQPWPWSLEPLLAP